MVEKEVDWEIGFVETLTVTSASLQRERIVEAPAAIAVVGEQEISPQGWVRSDPELLEFTPSAQVTQSGLYDYNINTRGFNSSLNRRVATLVDGRNPAVPFSELRSGRDSPSPSMIWPASSSYEVRAPRFTALTRRAACST